MKIAYNYANERLELLQVLPKLVWEEPHCHLSQQKMDSPTACAICAMPTADESNYSAASTLHPHDSGIYRTKFSHRLA